MGDFINIAKQYSKAGFGVIPVTSEKIPSIKKLEKLSKSNALCVSSQVRMLIKKAVDNGGNL